MMKTIVFTLLLSLVWSLGFSQSRVDRLKQELVRARQDTTRVMIMVDLCKYYRLSDPDSALYYGQQALTLAKDIKFPKGEMLALTWQSSVMMTIGNLPKSLKMGLKALQIAEENQLQEHTDPTLNAIGGIYRTLSDWPKALTYYKQQMIVGAKPSDKTGLAYAELAIGGVFTEMNQWDSSIYYLNKSLEHFNSLDRFEPSVFANLGDLEMKSGNTSLALDYYRKSLKLSIQNDEPTRTSSTYNDISKLYKRIDQRDSSIYYAKKGLATAELTSQLKVVGEAASLLSELYEPTDAKEALRYYKMATMAKDSLLGSASIQAVQLIAAQEQERQKEIELAKIAFQNQLKQYAALAGLVFFLLVAFILYRNNQQKQKANLLLQQQKEEIDIQRNKAEKSLDQLQSTQAQLIQSEKLASLGELTAGIAHEIQNPLNFVNNFAEVSAEMLVEMDAELDKGDVQEAKAISADLQQNLTKINHHGQRASAIVKGMLEHSRASTGVKEPTDLNALADEFLRLAYHGLRAKDNNFNATLETHFDPELPLVSVIPQDIGRVLLNLINNAFYALNEKQKQMTQVESETPLSESFRLSESYTPTITLRTKRLENAIEISVQDNGNGIPEAIQDKIFHPFFTTKPTGQGTGLGLSLAYDIVTKGHGGNLEVKSKEKDGTKFTIQLPVNSKS
jgi:two-component system, NtrC family, sensor kinase